MTTRNDFLSAKANVTIQGDKAIIDKPIILFRGDRNIKIKFTILENPFSEAVFITRTTNVIEEKKASYGRLVIQRGNGLDPLVTDIAPTEEGVIILTVKKEMINDSIELGAYNFHLVLYNETKTSQATLPVVENGILIKEPIKFLNGELVEETPIVRGEELPAFDSNGNYIKNNWYNEAPMDSGKLNKIENAIYKNSSQIKEITSFKNENLENSLGGI